MINLIHLAQGKAQTLQIRPAVRAILLSKEDDSVWAAIEPYMTPPGIEGSKQFDHMQAVSILRLFDTNGLLKSGEKPYTGRQVFDAMVLECRKLGLKVQHGRVTGLLESQPKNGTEPPMEPGEPDIE